MASSDSGMGRYWDRRARENAAYFINNSLSYQGTDIERFWASGPADLDALLGAVGAKIEPGDELVEIGCGIGRMTRPLAERGRSVRALDVSAEMLERAHSENSALDNVKWVLGDGLTLSGIEDGSADAVISYVVLQHVPEPEIVFGYVTEMGRVLRPGGWAAFQVSNDPTVHEPSRPTVGMRLRALFGGAPRGQRDAAWIGTAVEVADLKSTAKACGLAVERIEGEGSQFCLVLLRRS